MWDKLHKYLYGDSEKNTLEKVYEEWIKERKLDLDVSSKTYDRNVNTWNKYYKGNPITQIPMSKLTTNSIFKLYKSYTAGRAISRAELGNLKGIMNMVFDHAVNIETRKRIPIGGTCPMITMEGLIAVLALCATFFGLGYSIGRNSKH